MKKFFTLVVTTLVAMNLSAEPLEHFTTEGELEVKLGGAWSWAGKDLPNESNYDVSAYRKSSARANGWTDPENVLEGKDMASYIRVQVGQDGAVVKNGEPNGGVEDGVAIIKVRSKEDAIVDSPWYLYDDPSLGLAPWDTRCFIKFPEKFKADNKITISMEVRADKAISDVWVSCYDEPGQYTGIINTPVLNIGTTWTKYEIPEILLSSVDFGVENFGSIGFCLSQIDEENTVYFKNVKIMVSKSISDTFDVDKLSYRVTSWSSNEVEVIKNLGESDVVVPSAVPYYGENYSVTSIGQSAFSGCSDLTSITIPNSVTTIGYAAFRNCSGLTSVTIPNSVTSIGDEAFSCCSSLSSITLSQNLESIGNLAFSTEGENDYCPITSISIPHSVKTIGNEAFDHCRDLTLVSFEVDEDGNTSLISIGNGAFSGCSFTSITIPNSVKTIETIAFAENQKLTTVILGKGITEIAGYTFQNCKSLASVTIPDGVTLIGSGAFAWCESLTTIKLPESLTTMGENVFEGCQLKSIELPNSITAVPANLFKNNDLDYIKLGNNVKSIGKNAFGSRNMVIEIGTSTPPTIASDAFPNAVYLAEINVIVPDAAAETAYRKAAVWKEMTFSNMNNISEVTVDTPGDLSFELITKCNMQPAKVVGLKVKGTINAEDFDQMRTNMKSLLRLDLSECDITEIPDEALKDKTQLQELILPNKLQVIGNYAFQGCPYLTGKLNLPSGVTSIGDYAFEGTNYTSVNLPKKLQTIGSYAFYNLPIKQKIILPNALTSIGDYAFSDTQISGHAEIPDGIKYLGVGAFRNTLIDPVSLPDNPNGIKSINRELFQGCSSFDYIYIPSNITDVSGYAFDGCTNLTYVRMSPNLETLGEYAFQNTHLEYLKVPAKVEVLSEGVLKNCKSLESLSLPANLKSIEGEALMGCTTLRNLSVEAIEPPTIDKSSIRGINTDLCLISIPTQSYKAYVLAEYWGQFVQMRNDIAVETEGDGEIAFESVEEGEEEVSESRRRAQSVTEEESMTIANNGSSLYVPQNGKVRFIIIPGEGEKLLSATLDGENIMPNIVDGVYTATADKKNAKLIVKFSGTRPTGIEGLKNSKVEGLKYYDLNGRQVKTPGKGVYIIKGRKVLVK